MTHLEDLRLLKVVFTNECSRGDISWSMGREDEKEILRLGGEPLMGSSLSTGEESGISICARKRTASDFYKSALTRRRKGILSCGRSSCENSQTPCRIYLAQNEYLMHTPVLFEPLVFAQQNGTGSLHRIFVKGFSKKILQQGRAIFPQRRHIVLNDAEHD